MENVKITSFELENVKRVKAVSYAPTESGLTVIGGKNGQGKTSVLDAIAWALGGAKFRPTTPEREGSYNPPKLEVKLSNGLIVSRSGANNTLKVIDPEGRKSGQKILDEFIGQLALDLPKFMSMSNKDKAQELLKLLGVESDLMRLELEYNKVYADRRAIGQVATQKDKYAKELEGFNGVPDEPVSASELIQAQQKILLKNADNQKLRNQAAQLRREHEEMEGEIERRRRELEQLQIDFAELSDKLTEASKTAEMLQDESTAELEQQIADVDAINVKVRANQERARALQEVADFKLEYDDMSAKLEDIREAKNKLLESVNMPLPGLSIQDGELVYNGRQWDCMSGAEQLKVATAIVQALNPGCGFVLLDKLEQMDIDSMKEFGAWLEEKGLQVIATRVTTNADECSIFIEDGRVEGAPAIEEIKFEKKDWGGF